MENSSAKAVNRLFVYAKVHGNEKAIKEAEKLQLINNSYYHGLMGFLYSSIDPDNAKTHYVHALQLTKSVTERKVLTKKIKELGGQL